MPTMLDIARECGVSRSVVSLVLNGRDKELGIAARTRDQILRVAQEIGYYRNEMAASIGRSHSQVLAFVTARMGSVEYTGRIQNGVLDAASERGYTITMHRLNTASELEIIRKILGWRAAGVIFHVAELSVIRGMTAELERNGIPWGTVNLSNPGGIGITTDDRSGIENAVRLLGECGHCRIAFAANGAQARMEFQKSREMGYLEGLKRFFPEQKPLVLRLTEAARMNDMTYVTKLVQQLIRQKADAVICESDQLATSLGRAAQLKGYAIPNAFALVGFGNSMISETFNPPLCTISQDFEEMGRRTVNWLADVIEKRADAVPPEVYVPTEFIRRGSL